LPIRVKVKLLGVFRGLTDIDQLSAEAKHLNVRSVIRLLIDSASKSDRAMLIDPELNDPRPNALLLLNGREISILRGLETEVNDGDELVIIPIVHGG
jgi:molybdopterin synthase sulfur carrier subunit